jgi:hypothetical protein
MLLARRDPGGIVTVPTRPYVVIPATLRRRCGRRPSAPGPAGRKASYWNLILDQWVPGCWLRWMAGPTPSRPGSRRPPPLGERQRPPFSGLGRLAGSI